MIRLNLFVVLLAGVMGRQFCDYYFSPLVTFWSLFFYALHTLGEDETIAKLATGVKRFTLPDEFSFPFYFSLSLDALTADLVELLPSS